MLPHSLWHPSLRVRILAPAALVAVPAIALVLYTSFDRREVIERAVTHQTERLASLKALDQDRLIEGSRQLLMALAESRDVKEGDRNACSAYLRRIAPHLESRYTSLGMADSLGTLSCSGSATVRGSVADRHYFQRARATKAFVAGEIDVDRQTGRASRAFALPVLSDAGNVQHVLFAIVEVDPPERAAPANDGRDGDRLMYRNLFFLGIVSCLVMLGVKVVSDRLLLRPIAQLSRATRRLAAGDLGARVAASTPIPELHELAKDFDDMATGLEDREQERLLGEMKRKELEQQYHRAQKMDAIGRLAGGIAHDFNNMLTAILGYCELLLEDPKLADAHRGDIIEIEKAGKTAAQLTRQLLAFSRREIVEPVVIDLNVIVGGIGNMLRRLVGEHIDIHSTLAADLHAVRADRAQIEQVILNLAVNARDAMPGGGRLSIETANVHLADGVVSAYLSAPPGDYVMLAVSDTGSGMTSEVKQHLFEPFYTTKDAKGTGLGLATVYGIATQNKGGIVVESAVGTGSVFRIYYPRCCEQPAADTAAPAVDRPAARKATVLIVEDDPGIRELSRKILSRCGYSVLVADGGEEAKAVSERHEGIIDVLLSDLVMPGMDGPMVAAMLTSMRPGIKVVYMSGYTDNAIVRDGVMARDMPFLQKPFTPERLANKIIEVLG